VKSEIRKVHLGQDEGQREQKQFEDKQVQRHRFMKPPQLPDKNKSKQAGMSIATATILKGKSRDVGPIAVLLADQKKSTQVRAIFNSYGIWRFGVGCVLTPDETQVLTVQVIVGPVAPSRVPLSFERNDQL